jgi:hypothetical protein
VVGCGAYSRSTGDARGRDENHAAAKSRLPIPVLAVGSEGFIAKDNERQMREVADDVGGVILPRPAGA